MSHCTIDGRKECEVFFKLPRNKYENIEEKRDGENTTSEVDVWGGPIFIGL